MSSARRRDRTRSTNNRPFRMGDEPGSSPPSSGRPQVMRNPPRIASDCPAWASRWSVWASRVLHTRSRTEGPSFAYPASLSSQLSLMRPRAVHRGTPAGASPEGAERITRRPPGTLGGGGPADSGIRGRTRGTGDRVARVPQGRGMHRCALLARPAACGGARGGIKSIDGRSANLNNARRNAD